MDTDPLIRHNKFINYEKYITPKMVLSLNCKYLSHSGIVFARKDGEIVLLMRIDFSLLNDYQNSKLKKKNLIEKIDGDYYINFGQFKHGIYLLRNIRNFLFNFYIDNRNYDYIKLVPKGYDFRGKYKNKKIKDIYCISCGKKAVRNFNLKNKRFIGFIGENPNRCAYCFSRILITYFIEKIQGLKGSKAYIKSISSNPDLIDFYFTLLESTGIISTHPYLSFQKNFIPVHKKSYKDIPSIYLIEDNINENFFAYRSRICDYIDALTLSSSKKFNNNFKKKLKQHNLSIKDGWEIRGDMISFVNNGLIKNRSKKHIKDVLNQLILDYSEINEYKKPKNNKSNKKKKNDKSDENIEKTNKSNIKKKRIILIKSNELRRLTINPLGGLKNSFMDLLKENSLSKEKGIQIISILMDEINQNKLAEEYVEGRLYNLIYEFSAKLEKSKLYS